MKNTDVYKEYVDNTPMLVDIWKLKIILKEIRTEMCLAFLYTYLYTVTKSS